MRAAVLGLSDEQTGRHNLSDLHLAVLEAVAQRRRGGGLQTDLAKHFGLAASNFFYVTKARRQCYLRRMPEHAQSAP